MLFLFFFLWLHRKKTWLWKRCWLLMPVQLLERQLRFLVLGSWWFFFFFVGRNERGRKEERGRKRQDEERKRMWSPGERWREHFTVFVRKTRRGLWLIALRNRIRNVPKNTTFDLERLMGENSKLLKTKNNLRTNFTDNW